MLSCLFYSEYVSVTQALCHYRIFSESSLCHLYILLLDSIIPLNPCLNFSGVSYKAASNPGNMVSKPLMMTRKLLNEQQLHKNQASDFYQFTFHRCHALSSDGYHLVFTGNVNIATISKPVFI